MEECPGAFDMAAALREHPTRPPGKEVGLDELVALDYTGGTTGMPKGCEHTLAG
jgi:acyl-coenzyme A synthetase/AMP-(fatty) acid ligase